MLEFLPTYRLFNYFLSSQPLCFNLFGEFYADHHFGLLILKTFYPDLTKLISVNFEFAPTINYTNDQSEFDIAFEVEATNKKGLIGFESKYTDTFSFKPSKATIFYGDEGYKNYDAYLRIYKNQKIVLQNHTLTLCGQSFSVIKMTVVQQRQSKHLRQCFPTPTIFN